MNILKSFLALIGFSYFIEKEQQDNKYNIVTIPDQDAKCLDGSQPTFYFKNGFGDGENKFLIYFQGGGWIGGLSQEEALESAYNRSFTELGTSSLNPQQRIWEDGIFSRNQSNNPYFYNWNSIFINYCDGSGHQGYKKEPIKLKDRNLYFRGEKNVKSVIKILNNQFNMEQAERIVLSGCSAGGLAVYYWANYFNELFPNKVFAVPDSGLFLDMSPITQDDRFAYRNYYYGQILKIANDETDPINEKCVKNNPNELWKCLMSPYLVDYIEVPIFFVQSLYDKSSIPKLLKIDCVDDGTMRNCNQEQINYIEKYHQEVIRILQRSLDKHQNWGAWSPACINHCYEEWFAYDSVRFNVPEHSENTIARNIHEWLNDPYGLNKHIDVVNWPENHACSNLTNFY